jgi:hypothetical protein
MVQVRVSIPPSFEAMIDPMRMAQMITNGLSNASKFTVTGVVSVYVVPYFINELRSNPTRSTLLIAHVDC